MSSFGAGDSGRYYRPRLFGGGFRFFPPVIKALLISNVAVWLFLDVLFERFTVSGVPIFVVLKNYLALEPLGSGMFWPWQLLSYMFLHADFWHLFFNMLALWMFGMELENVWGSRKFLVFYTICGLGAAISNLFIGPLLGPAAPVIGASGAVFGVLVAFGMLFPDRPVYIWFLLPIKAKYFVGGFIALELFYLVTGTSAGIAHLAHLGGAAVGFVYLLGETNLIPFRSWWARLRPARRVENSQRWGRRSPDVREAKFYDIHTGKPMDDQEVTQEVIDAILDKIGRGGYQSLTEEEKRILNEASKKIQ